MNQDNDTYEEKRNERMEKMQKMFPRTFTVDIRSERHFARMKLIAMNTFGRDRFKRDWYYEDISGMSIAKIFYNADNGSLLDPLSQGDIKPLVMFGVKDSIEQSTIDTFRRELKKLVFTTPLVDVYDRTTP